MTEEPGYAINLQPAFDALEHIDIQPLIEANTHPWYNQTLCQVNDAVVRLGVVEGEYHWHTHDGEDEFFYVVDGHLDIELDDRTVQLEPRQGCTVPKGVRHRPVAPQRTVMLMIEQAGVQPTGN